MQELHFQSVILETECKQVTNTLHSMKQGVDEFHYINEKCKTCLDTLPNSRVNLIRRQTNQIVHLLARTSKFHASHHTLDHIPNCIFDTLLNEIQSEYFPYKKKIMCMFIKTSFKKL